MTARILITGPSRTIPAQLAAVRVSGIVPAIFHSSARFVPPTAAARGSGEVPARTVDPLPPHSRSVAMTAAVPPACHVHTLLPGANHSASTADSVATADQSRADLTIQRSPRSPHTRAWDTAPGTLADDIGTAAALMALAAFCWMPWWVS